MKEKTCTIIGFGVLGVSIIASLYVYFWLMLIKPIMAACTAFDAGVLTGKMIGIVVAKALLGGFPAAFVYLVGYVVAKIILEYGYKYGK